MSEKRIPRRNEVAEADTWNLKDMFESDEAWMTEYEALKALPARIESFKGHLADDAETLLSFMEESDEISLRLEPFYGYASCKRDQDTANSFYQDLVGRASALATAVAGASSFASSEIMAIDDDTLNLFYIAQPKLETYRRVIDSIRRRAAHILSPAEEKLLAAAGEMAGSPSKISSAFRDADMKFPSVKDSDGAEHQLTNGTFVSLEESADRALRENAFKAYYGRMGEFKNTSAAFLDGEFKKRCFYSAARKYPDTLNAKLDGTEVPEAVYTNLIDSVHKNLDKMYRYVALRKKLLGVDELHMYDVYTPIVPDVSRKISFSEAKDTVISALGVLGEDYISTMCRAFDERWIDIYENEGKRGGAYSTGSSRPHPYVLLNHKDDLNSMFTLAHELGHAMHSYYSTENQPVCTSDYVIFVAEVASTCNEILLMRYLLDRTEDKKERAYLINHFLDSFKGTVYRQTMFAEFELIMGRMAENDQTLTADALCEKYLELNRLYFGPDMISDDEISLEWTRIPHFFYNYYVFQYATGFSAAACIANRILSGEESAISDYKRFLSGGSSTDPISLLKLAGVDMSTSEPIDSALELFGELVDEMAAL